MILSFLPNLSDIKMFSHQTNFDSKLYPSFHDFIKQVKSFSISVKNQIDHILIQNDEKPQEYIIPITHISQSKIFCIDDQKYFFIPDLDFIETLNVSIKSKKEIIEVFSNQIKKEDTKKQKKFVFRKFEFLISENSCIIFNDRFFDIQKYRFKMNNKNYFNFFPIKLKDFKDTEIHHSTYYFQIINPTISPFLKGLNENPEIFIKIAKSMKNTEKRILCFDLKQADFLHNANPHLKMDLSLEIKKLYKDILSKSEIQILQEIIKQDLSQKIKQKYLKRYDFFGMTRFNDMITIENHTYQLENQTQLNLINSEKFKQIAGLIELT